MLEKIMVALERMKENRPLIHQITNYVTVNDCANITLAIGASPVMAQDINEAEEMVSHAEALVINIGTLDADTVEAMIAAGRRAKALSIPVVFDPVGVGATRYRTSAAKRILKEIRPEVIRCNMSELKALCGIETKVKGVDSVADTDGKREAAKLLAKRSGCAVAVTGKTDLITDGETFVEIENGHPHLMHVTGAGCMTTALVASFAAVSDPLVGAAAGVLSMGICGEIAAASLKAEEGIGTFRVRLMDAIFCLDGARVRHRARLAVQED